MSALGAREQGRDAATAFFNEYEERGITIETQKEQIKVLNATIAEQANRIDLLNRDLAAERVDSKRWFQYCVELSSQLKFVVSGAVRALKIADEVSAVVAQKADAFSKPVAGADIAEVERLMARAASNGEAMKALRPVMQENDLPSLNEIKSAVSPEPIPLDTYSMIAENGSHQFVDENGDNKGVEFRKYWMLRFNEFPSWHTQPIPARQLRVDMTVNGDVSVEQLEKLKDKITEQSQALQVLGNLGR